MRLSLAFFFVKSPFSLALLAMIVPLPPTASAFATIMHRDVHTLAVVDKRGIGPHPAPIPFSPDVLADMSLKTLRTTTPWTDGIKTFEGVLLSDILARAGAANAETLTLIALNDYTIAIPASDATKYNVLVAFKMDGKELEIRGKGPFWIVYPRDDFTELQDERFDHRWVWQLNRIEIE